MFTGIYAVLNCLTDKFYIGQAVNLKRRWQDHQGLLNNNSHYNKHLQSAYNKQWGEGFLFVVLEYCEPEKLIEREQYWIDNTKCYDRKIGYNKRLIAESNRGIKWDHPRIFSEEHKKKISIAGKGRKLNETQSKAISDANKNRIGIKYNVTKEHTWRRCNCEDCKIKRSNYRKNYRENQNFGEFQILT